MADHGRHSTEYETEQPDVVAEATAEAAAGATTDTHGDQNYNQDLTNGVEPDPDLAQGESD